MRTVDLTKRFSKGARIAFPTRLEAKEDKENYYEDKILEAEACAKILYRVGAKRVWLFGSLAEGEVIDRLSDIDIAVEGLKRAALLKARREIKASAGCRVDVVCLETANPGFRNSIFKNRVLLGR